MSCPRVPLMDSTAVAGRKCVLRIKKENNPKGKGNQSSFSYYHIFLAKRIFFVF